MTTRLPKADRLESPVVRQSVAGASSVSPSLGVSIPPVPGGDMSLPEPSARGNPGSEVLQLPAPSPLPEPGSMAVRVSETENMSSKIAHLEIPPTSPSGSHTPFRSRDERERESAESLRETIMLHLALQNQLHRSGSEDTFHLTSAREALVELQAAHLACPDVYAATAEFHAFSAGLSGSLDDRQSAWQQALRALSLLQTSAPRTSLADDTLAHLAAYAYNQASQS